MMLACQPLLPTLHRRLALGLIFKVMVPERLTRYSAKSFDRVKPDGRVVIFQIHDHLWNGSPIPRIRRQLDCRYLTRWVRIAHANDRRRRAPRADEQSGRRQANSDGHCSAPEPKTPSTFPKPCHRTSNHLPPSNTPAQLTRPIVGIVCFPGPHLQFENRRDPLRLVIA